MKLPEVFNGAPSDDTLPYPKSFQSVECFMKLHCPVFEHDSDKIIWIGGVLDGMAGIWYDARAEYMKKYFKVDKWNPFVGAMEERFLDRQEESKAPDKRRELKYKGDIERNLTDMETFNYKVCLVGTLWRTMLTDGHSEDLQHCLPTTNQEPRNDIVYADSVRRDGLAMEQFPMLQKKHSSKHSSASL
jgi:hypothetical protein